ncbi:hypothetical protein FHS18_000482 [Paenibacillus phyllosphaerae]|uniref:ABM domain-containing protein n=1 Tax=Paenibacillus phyllosphaerae TaxID=274593 RepID=A0A7W5ATF6_9BACL|nr:hypothetical protein [Paenibacillus phyllosphaerae]MBB3108454.1 hypothetical protein [Paenibacillus phyllosphaerae]
MAVCFVEYRIAEEHEEAYLEWIAQQQAADPRFLLYEGTDQPLLFVEVWQATDVQAAEAIKKERCDERSSWRLLSEWIPGGPAKLHAWTFRPVT